VGLERDYCFEEVRKLNLCYLEEKPLLGEEDWVKGGGLVSSIMKCNTLESERSYAILRMYARGI